MNGGIFDKLGNWFEEDGVIWHLLLIADEQEQTLLWEGNLEDSLGVDCWIRRNTQRIAEQYKTKSTGPWSIADLAHRRKRANGSVSNCVFSYARTQLQRTTDAATEYIFVTDNKVPDLEKAIESALETIDPTQWLHEDIKTLEMRSQLIAGLGFDADASDDLIKAHQLVRRMRVQLIDHQTLRERNDAFARALCSTPERLLEHLRQLARTSVSHEVNTELIRDSLTRAGIKLHYQIEHQHLAVEIDAAFTDFQQSTNRVRHLALIQRPEAGIAVSAALAPDHARTIIIHGPAGVGKTEIVLQIAEKLRAAHIPTLVLRADEADRPPIGPDPVRALSRYAGGQRACLVIDQVDQVVLAGERAQHLLKPLMQWVALARILNVAVIVGCRAIDVDQDTHLKRMLAPDDSHRVKKIEIKDLTEAQATDVLSQSGIPVDTIHSELLPLIRRPLVLHLLTQLATKGGNYTRARTILDLVDSWWGHLRKPNGLESDAILTSVATAVENDGKLSVDRLRLPHPTVIDALVESGVLICEQKRLIRPFHQVLVDVWLARQWSEVPTFTELLQHIGDRSDQSLHHARRLRLAVQLFASRGNKGAKLCNAIMRSDQFRPLLKRSLLLGVATIDMPDDDWVDQITEWLQDETLQDVVRETVVYQRLPWMDKLHDWLKDAWKMANDQRRSRLLALLAAVSRSRGDFVVDCLMLWSQHNLDVLTQADFVFWHDPSEDSEKLFELRLRYLAETQHRHAHHLQWTTLLAQHPERSMRLLAYHLNHENNEALIKSPPDWFRGWPKELPQDLYLTGLNTWRLLKPHWLKLSVENPWNIHVGNKEPFRHPSVAACLVDILSNVLAHALQNGEIVWSALLSELPLETRFIDQWLLLRLGAALDITQVPDMVLYDTALWFMNNPNLCELAIGMVRINTQFAEQFIATIAPGLNDETHQQLVDWTASYADKKGIITTSAKDDISTERNEATIIGYRLLSHTDQTRWAEATKTLYASFVKEFGPVLPQDIQGIHSRTGWVRSDISDTTALQMTCAEWVDKLRSASPTREWHDSIKEENSILSGDLETRLRQFRYIVPHHPRRFYDGLQLFIDATPPLPREVIRTIIDGIVREQKPDRPPPQGDWEALSDDSVAAVFAIPIIKEDKKLVSTLSDVVRNRSRYPWSKEIIDHLITVATGETVAGIRQQENEGLINYRIHEQACRAIDALANFAHDHETVRAPLLDLADSLIHHEDPGRRASAGMHNVLIQLCSPLLKIFKWQLKMILNRHFFLLLITKKLPPNKNPWLFHYYYNLSQEKNAAHVTAVMRY
jgi:hypothetical protein